MRLSVGRHDRPAPCLSVAHAALCANALRTHAWRNCRRAWARTRWKDRLALLRMAWRVRKLGRRDMRELLRIGGMNVYDLLQENFDNVSLKGALAFDAVLGANFGPRSPGTVLTLLYRLAAESRTDQWLCRSRSAAWAQYATALCEVLRRQSGAVLRTGCDGDQDRGARGSRLRRGAWTSGERIDSRCVVSNADPKTTFLRLLGARHLDAGIRAPCHSYPDARIWLPKCIWRSIDCRRLPGWHAEQLGGRLLIAPSLDYVERAYNHSKYGEFSKAPIMEITLPSINDPTLAPPGRHVLSAIVQYVPYALKEGWQSTGGNDCWTRCSNCLENAAPGLRGSVLSAEILTPLDIENEFLIEGGHWHHGDLGVRSIHDGSSRARCGSVPHAGGEFVFVRGGRSSRRRSNGNRRP